MLPPQGDFVEAFSLFKSLKFLATSTQFGRYGQNSDDYGSLPRHILSALAACSAPALEVMEVGSLSSGCVRMSDPRVLKVGRDKNGVVTGLRYFDASRNTYVDVQLFVD